MNKLASCTACPYAWTSSWVSVIAHSVWPAVQPLSSAAGSGTKVPPLAAHAKPWFIDSDEIWSQVPYNTHEVHAEIGINWFLDQGLLKGGYVRILAESLLWEERLGKTRIRTIEGLTTCMEPHRGWTIASSSWNILVRKRWLDREQELITVIQEETKRTEERSPTWSILRALQKINKAKRIEGEAIMSASPFFQSAGRGDLKFWGEDDRPTVVVWESLSE